MASSSNSRASLLAGLRTGGVRSPSASAPPPSVSFNIPPFLQDDPPLNKHNHIPLNPNSVPFSPAHFNNQSVMPQHQLQSQAIQLQLLQLEMMRIQSQALQAQQVQAELMAQAQRQQAQPQVRERRTSFNPPATAAPHITAFDLRSATLSAQMRRANQTEQLKAQLGLPSAQAEDQVPMTAALGGRFGGRVSNPPNSLSRYVIEEPEQYVDASPKLSLTNSSLPSRSDQAANWRRGGSYRAVSSPAFKITPPQADNQRSSPSPPMTARGRPQPLHITPAASQPLLMVTVVDTTEEDEAEATSPSAGSASFRSDTSSPITPPSHLSPREEATKKLYEGLGIGRPLPSATFQPQQHIHPTTNHRLVSHPMRQPRGPPSGADELGPKNFATRIRRQAIGGLGMLMGARERRESFIEAY
ncbi:hypothetical protein M378DRAFT_72315 [Amanita muscaria Koide BX008]|uniref:Uncharacterized protein n=1 Tax=Amanita muscaria (strain Koide BX008) TaxID=946122 RepID=A0A0C2TMB7_AMAMK|nr:hypothetical protein M378DRAFT_72315 [Amanita muscaria Koide BX008]